MERNIRLTLAYDGTRYQGWQRQPAGRTIQGVIEEKIYQMAGGPVTVIGSGRTDSGVHALGQVCHFWTRSPLASPIIKRGLNGLLPEDIYVREAHDAPADFHARYSAKAKTYEYRLLNREEPDIFQRNYLWHVRQPLDISAMTSCGNLLKGRHDFSSFRSAGSGNTNPVRTIFHLELSQTGNGLIRWVVEADGFLRHMIRNIMGTVVAVGRSKITVEEFGDIFRARDRSRAGVKAPAKGLYLVDVRY